MGLDNAYGIGSLKPGVCTSSTRPASPFDGQVIYETDTNLVAVYDSNVWVYKTPDTIVGSVLQVASATKTDAFTTASTTYVDLTGLSVTITPKFTSSKILVFYSVQGQGVGGTNMGFVQIVRGSTAVGNADTAGSRPGIGSALPELGSYVYGIASNSFLDSPNTTSATTYKIQVKSNTANTLYVNRTVTDADNSVIPRSTSSITVMEIAG